MNFQSMLGWATKHPVGFWIMAVFAAMGLLWLLQKYRMNAVYLIIILFGWIAAQLTSKVLYFYAFLLGMIVAFAEIIGKFSDEPIKSLSTPQAVLYHLFNGAISAFALGVLLLYDVPSTTRLDQLKVVMAAGLGSMLVMRSKLFNIKVGGEEISFGPEQIIKVFLRYMERAIDRVRARSRVEFVKTVMDNIDFDKTYDYSVTMLASAQTLSEDELKKLNDQIEAIKKQSALEPQLKSYKLGFLLLNNMGEDFVAATFEDHSSDWLIRAPLPPPTQSLLDKLPFTSTKSEFVNYVAYGGNMTTRRLRERLGWSSAELQKFLEVWPPKSCIIKGYRLVFNKPAAAAGSMLGFANIVPDSNESVQGVMYQIPPTAMEFLDKFEPGYLRKLIKVTVGGKEVDAYVYTAESPRGGLKPSREYLELVLEGAKEHRLSDEYVEQLAKAETMQ